MESYKKSKSTGLEGVQFQLNLLTVCLLNALHSRSQWRISMNNAKAGKFDDIVVELSDGSAILIQVKYRKSKRITKNLLLSRDSNIREFGLLKYFLSYTEIKRNFKVRTVIICTNTDMDQNGLENMLNTECVDPDHILYYECDGCSFLTCNENILPEMNASEAIITDENMTNFFKHLQIFTNYPCGKKLDRVIEQLLTRLSDSKLYRHTSLQEIYRKVEDWIQQPNGEYLTEIRTRAMFCEIKSDKYCELLRNCNISFKYKDFNFTCSKRIFHITIEDGHLMQMLKIYHTLRDQSEKLFVNPEEDVEVQKCIIKAFELPRYTYLILTWPETMFRNIKIEISNQLRDILEEYPYKKVIFVAKTSSDLVQEIGFKDIVQFDGSVKFEDFSKDSQERLLNGKNIIFQGHTISIKELLHTQEIEDYTKILNLEILENIVRGEELIVGSRAIGLDEDMASDYISRIFKRKGMKEYIFSEKYIFDLNEKMILIEGCAGMGKSTTLTKLAITIKKEKPYLWVTKINLNDYTSVLRGLKDKKTLSVIEMLESQQTTKFETPFDKSIFSTQGKVVLILDGIEKISPDYMDPILDMIRQCQEASNFEKIFLAITPQLSKELEANLKVDSFEVLPFTQQNQVQFLTHYWAHNLQVNGDKDKERCQFYARTLTDKISWRNHFSATPLHLRMLAEIFQENVRWTKSVDWMGCKEFLHGSEEEPEVPETYDITKLYNMFIEKKRDVFINKGNPSGNIAANQALIELFENCLSSHRILALEVILGKNNSDFFSNCHQDNKTMEDHILKLGIVQRSDDRFQFIHQTFAEYFVADSILRELQLQNQNVGFQKLFIDEILSNSAFTVVRGFLDGFLQGVGDSLPSTIFKSYVKSTTIGGCNRYLIHSLAKEGLVAILQLILKCINYRCSTGKLVTDLKNVLVSFSTRNTNTLNALRCLTLEKGISFNDKSGKTPLHYAIEEGHLDMRNFLIRHHADVDMIASHSHKNVPFDSVEQGDPALKLDHIRSGDEIFRESSANIHIGKIFLLPKNKHLTEIGQSDNKKDNKGLTDLLIAVKNGQLDTVKFLVSNNVDVNDTDDRNRTALHLATVENQLEIVIYLIESGADVNIKDSDSRTSLHLAADFSKLNIVKCLVKYGSDINLKDDDGCKPLHLAARRGRLDIVIYLVEHGAHVNDVDFRGRTILHKAAACYNTDVLKYLVERGADINNIDDNGCTPLLVAAAHYGEPNVNFLVKLGSDINIKNRYGDTVLHKIVESGGDLGIVKSLLELGANINDRGCKGRTPLHVAARSGLLDIVKYLVASGSDFNIKDSDGDTVLHKAVEKGDMNTVQYLVELGTDVNSRGYQGSIPLHLAARWGQSDIVKYLVTSGSDINIKSSKGDTVLHEAIRSDDMTIIEYLVKLGVDVDSRGYKGTIPLHLAARYGKLDVVKYLINCGSNFNITDNDGRLALHWVAEGGKPDAVNFLVKCGINVNVKDNEGYTALHLAAKAGKLSIIRALVRHGADINITNNVGSTALHLAAENGKLNALNLLLGYGINVDVSDNEGHTVLHLAAKNRELDTVKFLLQYGINVDLIDNEGHTALHLAAEKGNLDIVKYFIDYGINVDVSDNEGNTSLHLAAKTGKSDTFKFLLQYGADINCKNNEGYTVLDLATKNRKLDAAQFFEKYRYNFYIGDSQLCTPQDSTEENNESDTSMEQREDHNVTDSIVDIRDEDVNTEQHLTVDVNSQENITALHLAASEGQLDTIKTLAAHGVDLNIKNEVGRSALHSAASRGQLAVVKCLVENGVEINVKDDDGNTALHLADEEDDLDAVKCLVQGGADVNTPDDDGNTILHCAAECDRLNSVEYLVTETTADINLKNNGGRTPLHLAVKWGNLGIVQFLIEREDINVNIVDNDGRTPLHFTAEWHRLDTVKLLVEKKVNINIKDSEGCTAIHLAVRWGNLDTAVYLAKNGADLNIPDSYGRTVLHMVAEEGESELVKSLVENGAIVNITDSGDCTALDLAKSNGHTKIVEYLSTVKSSKVTNESEHSLGGA